MSSSNIEELHEQVCCLPPSKLGQDFAIVGDGQYVEDLLRWLSLQKIALPRAVYVRKINNNIPLELQKDESTLRQNKHRQLVLGTNAFQIQMLQRIRPLISNDTQVCDLLLDKGQLSKHSELYFWQEAPTNQNYILIVTLYPSVVVEGYLHSFVNFVRKKGIEIVVRHPFQKVADQLISDACSVLVWNGSTEIFQRLLQQCQLLNRRVTFAECGFFPQSKNLYFDRAGVNLESQLSTDKLVWLDEQHERRMKETQLAFFKNVKPFHWHGDYTLVALQVPHDSNVQCHSSFGHGMQSFIDLVLRQFPNDNLLFKPHPKDRLADSYDYGYGHRVEADVRSLILGAKRVVAINSSVLYEATLAGVPVDCYGDCLLNRNEADKERILQAMIARQFPTTKNVFSRDDVHQFSWFAEDGLFDAFTC